MTSEKIALSILGPSLYEPLQKAIVKLGTKSVVDISELHDALKIAPKSIIAFLMKELGTMKKDEAKEVSVPWDENVRMLINKKDEDVYAGHISKAGKVVHEFSLCSIPQLAAHLLSFSEMYDEVPNAEAPKAEESKQDDVKQQMKALDDKINALMMIVAGQNSIAKSEQEPNLKKKFIESVKKYSLAKAGGLGPRMPAPPKAGSNVGKNNGITKEGIHSPKTEATDSSPHVFTQLKNAPNMKVPEASVKQPTQPKQIKLASSEKDKVLTFKKSELNGKCIDCGQAVGGCACFKALSKPEIKKSDSSSVTLKFRSDWDQESISALYKSIKKFRE